MHQPQVGAFFNGGLSGGDENRATRPQVGEKQSGGLFFSPWVESHRFRHQAELGSPLPLRSVLIRSPLGSPTALRVLCPAFSFTPSLAIEAVSVPSPPPKNNRTTLMGRPVIFVFVYRKPPAVPGSSQKALALHRKEKLLLIQ